MANAATRSSVSPSSTFSTDPPGLSSEPLRRTSSGTTRDENLLSSSSSRKQDARRTKSRTGCRTCKKKRLKCDERKPTCEQCERRKVKCEGYARDFKWKAFGGDQGSFELTSITTPGPIQTDRRLSTQTVSSAGPSPIGQALSTSVFPAAVHSPTTTTKPHPLSDDITEPDPSRSVSQRVGGVLHNSTNLVPSIGPAGAPESSQPVIPFSFSALRGIMAAQDTSEQPFVAPYTYETSFQFAADDSMAKKVQVPLMFDDSMDWQNFLQRQGELGTDTTHIYADTDKKTCVERFGLTIDGPGDEEDYDRIASDEADIAADGQHDPSWLPSPLDDPDQMLGYFNRETCRVLTILDDTAENPWREMIVPLIPTCPPLYHATAALTSFQILKDPRRAMAHMNKCVEYLSQGYHNMSYETAIATHLSMAFAESWNPLSPNSGHTHVQAARHLIRAAFDIPDHSDHDGFDAPLRRSKLLRFLCKTFVYLDVLLRLTSVQNSEANDFEAIMASVMAQAREETYLDPLMGCASTLFPVLGHVANLVQKSCQSTITSPDWLRQAIALQTQLEAWQPPSQLQEQARSSLGVRNCLHLAEAYKCATLLHLHQGVPELPPRPSDAELAKRTLYHLGHVEVTPKATFVQIYPLLVAGSEAQTPEDRDWVRKRLRAMGDAAALGCVLASSRVAEEVWKRRDRARAGYAHDPSKTISRGSAYMARGELHWLRVLADWNWQVLLG